MLTLNSQTNHLIISLDNLHLVDSDIIYDDSWSYFLRLAFKVGD